MPGAAAVSARAAMPQAGVDMPGDIFESRGDLLVHRPSGMAFPSQVGLARRIGEKAFNETGDYVGVRYSIPLSDGAVARVQIGMVALPGMTAREHYLSRRAIVVDRLVRAEPLTEAPLPELDFDNFYGRFSDGHIAEGLITAQFGDWGVRAETEYPASRDAEAYKAIAGFLQALNWQPLRERTASPAR